MLKNIFPILDWLPIYKKEWLRGDISAGFTVGVILIPQGIAYAMIAGLPPIYGLYTAMIPQIVYAIFGTSRQLAVGPVAMDSLIVGAGIATLADVGTQNFIEFAILLASLIGILQFLFGVFKLGFLVNFLSKPVISGFTSAASLIIGMSQLNHLLGINLSRNSVIQNIILDVGKHIQETHLLTLTIGITAIIIILLIKKYMNKLPAALVVVIIGITLAKLLHFENYGIKIVGEIPKGLPAFRVPNFNIEILKQLFPIALTLSLISFLEAISIAKAAEAKNSEGKVIPNKELIALGLGNFIGSFFQAYPSTGGFSRSAVSSQAGAKTPLYSIIAAFVVGFTLLYLTPVFYYLPKAVLAAIIMVAVIGLMDFKFPKELLKYSKIDFLILNFTLFITAGVGIKEGILAGALFSVVMLVYKSTKPHVAILGKVSGTHHYRSKGRFEEVEIDHRILIMRFDSQLHFANAAFFKDVLQENAEIKGDKLEILIIDGKSINNIDSSAIYALNEVIDYFQLKNVQIFFTDLKGPVRDLFKKSGLTDRLGMDVFYMSIQQGVDSFNNQKGQIKTEREHVAFISQTNIKKEN